MLFLDFVLSKRGQKVYQESNYLPAHPEDRRVAGRPQARRRQIQKGQLH